MADHEPIILAVLLIVALAFALAVASDRNNITGLATSVQNAFSSPEEYTSFEECIGRECIDESGQMKSQPRQ